MKHIAILDKIRDEYEDGPFSPLEAMELLTFMELPDFVRSYLAMHGPGTGATKMMARWLKEHGCTRLGTRTSRGYLWTAPDA